MKNLIRVSSFLFVLILLPILTPEVVMAWTSSAVDSNGCTGETTSIATDSSGNTHISYYDCTNADLKYATNRNVTPGTGNCTNTDFICETVDSDGDAGQGSDIAIDLNNKVHISYYSASGHKYATNRGVTQGTGNCTNTDWDCETTGAGSGVNSIAVDPSGYAHVSYTDYNAYLYYATNASGTWTTSMIWDGIDLWNNSASIATDSSGDVHIAVVKNCIDDFYGLMHVTNKTGSWVVDRVTNTPQYGYSTSIVLDSSDMVHIGYSKWNGGVKYATNRGVTPGTGNCYFNHDWKCETVFSTSSSYSMAPDVLGNIHFSYYDSSNSDLKYATNSGVRPGTGNCTNNINFNCETVDDIGDVGNNNSIAVDLTGKVHFSYYDATNEDLKYATKPGNLGETPVPWNSEDYHAHGDASYGGIFGSGSDSDDKYSPPLPLPITASASVYKGPPGTQQGSANSTITAYDMEVATSVIDSANRGYASETSANSTDGFTGSFITTHDLFQFSYSYVYSIGANCGNYDDEPYWSDNSGSASLKVTDLTGSVTLIDETFLNVAAGCYMNGSYYDSGSGSDVISVPVTVGHDIKVEFGIYGDSSASGCTASGGSNLTLQYYTALNCIDPPVINDRTGEYYASLQEGYDNPAMLDEDIIQSQALVIPGDLVIDRDILVIFEGGYNCDYSAIIGQTTLVGNITISDGTVIIQNGTIEVT